MSIKYGFFNSAESEIDRDYDASDFNRIMRGSFTDGRLAGYGDPATQFVVSPTMNPYEINVTPGAYLLKGLWLVSSEIETLHISNAESDLALVIRYSVANRDLAFAIVSQSAVNPNSEAVLAFFTKTGNGAIINIQRYTDVSLPCGDNNLMAATLYAVDWVGDLHTLADPCFLPPNMQDVWPEIADSATQPEKDAFHAAAIWTYAQADGSVTLMAHGGAPTVNLPVALKTRRYAKAQSQSALAQFQSGSTYSGGYV